MKFRYYITNLHEGDVEGTNDNQVAIDFAASEDYFVVDSERGEWLQASGNAIPVEDAAG